MEKQKSPIALRIISLVLLIGWMGLIFYLSHQDATESAGLSSGLIEYVVKLLMPNISSQRLAQIVASLQFVVRKGAHFSLYGVLGVLSFTSVVTYSSINLFVRCFLSFVISALYSVSDEYHQTFIDGRSGEIRDVLIDSLGTLAGIIFALIIYRIYKAIKNRGSGNMKKKQYMELTEALGQRLNSEKHKTAELLEENSALIAQLDELRKRIVALENSQSALTPAQETTVKTEASLETVSEIKEPTLSSGIIDGAKIIGKIVLSSAKYCNDLTSAGAPNNAKELVNLILSRTEVAKAEILRLSALELSPAERVLAMERELNSAEDYFKSVMAQK